MNCSKKLFLASFVIAGGLAAVSAREPCNLAVVTRELPSKTRVCDPQTVKDLAARGQVYEQNQMGLSAMLVVGRDTNVQTAVSWFQRSAEHGYAPAQVNLALLYANGWGVQKNFGAALQWLQRAAEQHSAAAYYNLGELYFKGEGVRQDNAEALRYFRLGADAGDTYAQTNLGYLYDRGLGVPRDPATAVNWYRKAADAGNPLAEANLGDLYHRGEGVPHDEVLSAALFRKAAEQGHTGAQVQLAYRLAMGIGVAKDPQAALSWASSAVLGGDNRGEDLIRTLQKLLAPKEVQRAQKLAAELHSSTALAAQSAQFQP